VAERGIAVTHESIRQWCGRFGADFARSSAGAGRHRETSGIWTRSSSASTASCTTSGRAVAQHGVVLDVLVQDRRNAGAAKRFFKHLLTGLKFKPRRIVTDRLRSYGAARRDVLPEVRHRASRYLNNHVEKSHRPTRRRERQMQRFKSPDQPQHFLSSHAFIYARSGHPLRGNQPHPWHRRLDLRQPLLRTSANLTNRTG
jgi:putative transposase